jgi:hypothetical protein
VDSSARTAASDAVPFSRIAWIAGALSSAVQPSRLWVGFLAALLLWIPGLFRSEHAALAQGALVPS